jgi:hypothetical protein
MGERIFLSSDENPQSIVEKRRGLTDFQAERVLGAYVGKWMRVGGPVVNITASRDYVMVSIMESVENTMVTTLNFNGDRDRLELINQNDGLIANGRIVNVGLLGLSLDECEILEIIPRRAVTAPPGDQLEESANPGPEPAPAKTPIPAAEMERFARLYLELWGVAAVEAKALVAIRACYPDHNIGRDPFYKKFREIRGPGMRGNPAFRGE